MIVLAVISGIIGIALSIYIGISIANIILYNKIDDFNTFGSPNNVLSPNTNADEFTIITDKVVMTTDLRWYSEYVNNPVIRKRGEGLGHMNTVTTSTEDELDEVFKGL